MDLPVGLYADYILELEILRGEEFPFLLDISLHNCWLLQQVDNEHIMPVRVIRGDRLIPVSYKLVIVIDTGFVFKGKGFAGLDRGESFEAIV